MKIFNRFMLAGLMIAGTAFGVSAQTPAPDAFSEALMKAYTSVLNEDPHDWEALFRRANEYYRRDDYVKALADIDLAIKYIPETETDMKAQAYSLRANIHMMSHRYEKALADLNEVLTLLPGDYVTIYQRATTLYNLERYPEAKTDFKILQQMNSRSLEAVFGLARIAVKENNLGTANELIDQALTLSPNNSEVYMRRADVHTLMGNPQGAVEDYIMAISTDDRNTGRALSQLVKLSRTDYPVVIAGLSNAIRQAPENGMFYYIRAMIAQGHCNYTAAIDDYNKIIEGHLDSYPGINAALAECYYALGEYEKAMMNIDYAVNAAPENADYNILKSKILLALNEPDNALASADKAVEANPDLNAAIIARANALIALKNYTEASVALSEAAMNNPEDPELYIVRGWVLEKFRDNAKSGKASYER
ncbi:MAG: tetratricopeptide repeat protein, partial [Duncaniella sp.]|nr:tetratricopeptide repeat protein [Duncaniella sp.]